MRCLLRSSLRPRVWELCLDACLSMVALLGDGGAEEIHGGETAGLLEVSGGGGAQAVGRGVSALADRVQMAAAEHAHRTGGRAV